MNIQEFVQETLTQIANGVLAAQRQLSATGALVNPLMHKIGMEHSIGVAKYRDGEVVGLVEFDLAVHADTQHGNKGGIGVVAGAITLGTTRSTGASSGSESRVKFSIPMVLPSQNLPKK